MKKAIFTGFLGIAFAFAMAACGGNATEENNEANDTCKATVEQTDQACEHHCDKACQNAECAATNCEKCDQFCGDTCNTKKPCCKDKENGQCPKDAQNGECRKDKQNGECCKDKQNK